MSGIGMLSPRTFSKWNSTLIFRMLLEVGLEKVSLEFLLSLEYFEQFLIES